MSGTESDGPQDNNAIRKRTGRKGCHRNITPKGGKGK